MNRILGAILLRWWAFCQFIYDLFVAPSWMDRRLSVRDELFGTCRRGHLNRRPFLGLDTDYPELRRPVIAVNRLEEIVSTVLAKRARVAYRLGLLVPYLHVQQRHMERCGKCRDFARDVVLGELRRGHIARREILPRRQQN